MSYNTSTYAGKEQVVSDYQSAVENDPFLTFKSFCGQNGIEEYKPLLWWCNRQGISINKIQSAARCSNKLPLAEVGKNLETSFLQFVPQSAEGAYGNLKNVSITFPDGVNIALQESTVESVVSLLTVYQSRKGRAE
jgi:hypothetical protein